MLVRIELLAQEPCVEGAGLDGVNQLDTNRCNEAKSLNVRRVGRLIKALYKFTSVIEQYKVMIYECPV